MFLKCMQAAFCDVRWFQNIALFGRLAPVCPPTKEQTIQDIVCIEYPGDSFKHCCLGMNLLLATDCSSSRPKNCQGFPCHLEPLPTH